MGPLSIVPSFFTAHTFCWGDWHRQSFGEQRAAGISPTGYAYGKGVDARQMRPWCPPTCCALPSRSPRSSCAEQRQPGGAQSQIGPPWPWSLNAFNPYASNHATPSSCCWSPFARGWSALAADQQQRPGPPAGGHQYSTARLQLLFPAHQRSAGISWPQFGAVVAAALILERSETRVNGSLWGQLHWPKTGAVGAVDVGAETEVQPRFQVGQVASQFLGMLALGGLLVAELVCAALELMAVGGLREC